MPIYISIFSNFGHHEIRSLGSVSSSHRRKKTWHPPPPGAKKALFHQNPGKSWNSSNFWFLRSPMNSDVSKRSKNLFCGRPYDPPGTFQAPMGGGLNSKMTGKWVLLEGTLRRKMASNGRLHNHSQKLRTQRNQIAGRMPKTALEPRATTKAEKPQKNP